MPLKTLNVQRLVASVFAAGIVVVFASAVGPGRLLMTSAMPPSRQPVAAHMESDAPSGGSVQSGRPATVVEAVSCEKLADIPGKAVTTVLVHFPPNAHSGAHRHPGSVTAFVLRGTLRSQLEGGPVGTYGAGETWFEPKGALHLFADNASSTERAELLAFFVTDEDCGPLVVPEPH